MQPGQIVFEGKTKKGLPILIRYPQESDLNALLEYINTLSREKTFIRVQGEEITLDEEKEYLDKIIKHVKTDQGVHLFAISNGKLIGVADTTLKEKVEKHLGNLGISVAKEFRDQGVGRLLMEKIMEEAKNNLPGLKIVTLSVFDNNPVAKSMYESFGLKQFGRLPKGIQHKGKLVDHIYLYKFID